MAAGDSTRCSMDFEIVNRICAIFGDGDVFKTQITQQVIEDTANITVVFDKKQVAAFKIQGGQVLSPNSKNGFPDFNMEFEKGNISRLAMGVHGRLSCADNLTYRSQKCRKLVVSLRIG